LRLAYEQKRIRASRKEKERELEENRVMLQVLDQRRYVIHHTGVHPTLGGVKSGQNPIISSVRAKFGGFISIEIKKFALRASGVQKNRLRGPPTRMYDTIRDYKGINI
jgi:hypothetical protein